MLQQKLTPLIVRLFLTAFFSFFVVVGSVSAQISIQNIQFEQIDWFPGVPIADTPNSVWGHVTIDFIPDVETRYINIVANDNSGGADQWIVQNLLISSGLIEPNPFPLSTTFDLGLIGGVDGVDFTDLEFYITDDSNPAASMPAPIDPPVPNTPVGDRVFVTGGYTVGAPAPPGPPQAPAAPGAQVPEIDIKRINVPNIESATNQCAPAAVANSFEWLSDYWDLGLTDNANTIVNDLDTAMGRAANQTIGPASIISGKLKYVKDNKLPVNVHFQSSILSADVTEGEETAKFDGGPPTWEYIKKQIELGQDVEIGYIRDGGGGHFVTVTGVYQKKDGTKGIHFQDDTDQNNAGGQTSTSSDIGTNNGHINILKRPKNQVKDVIVESPTVKAMIKSIKNRIFMLSSLIDVLIVGGGSVTQGQADQAFEAALDILAKVKHLKTAVYEEFPEDIDAQDAADSLEQSVEDLVTAVATLHAAVSGNPGGNFSTELNDVKAESTIAEDELKALEELLFVTVPLLPLAALVMLCALLVTIVTRAQSTYR